MPPAECIRVQNFNPGGVTVLGQFFPVPGLDFFAGGLLDRQQWERYAAALGYPDVLAMLNYYFRGRLIAEWDEIFANDIAPVVVDKVVDGLRLTDFATDVTAAARYTGGDRVIRLTVSGTTSKARRDLPAQLEVRVNDTTLAALRGQVVLTVENVRLEYSTPHFNGLLHASAPGDDLLDGVRLDIPESPDERRNPRREDRYLAAALLDHLNANLEYYNKVLWSRLDPDRRFMLLDGFAIQTFDDDGVPIPGPAGLRSLASVVKNDVIAVAGNSLVLPVAPGCRVSGAFAPPAPPADGEAAERPTLLDHYRPLTPVPPYRISVPTKGVFAEAVQGACNACERIETDRLQDWSRFPIDEPTEIAPITLPSPAPQAWQAAFRDFAPPIVNVQNAPTAPAPGAGLAGLAELLGSSDVFRDVTGLDANQQNAIRTYLSNQENARAFGEMAKELAMQGHNSRNSKTIMDGIQAARGSNTISQEEAGRLTKEHLQQQIDGGAGRRTQAEAEQQGAATPLTRAVVEAAAGGRDVTASRQTGSTSEAVSIRGGGEATVLAEATGVPAMRQPKPMDCWATAAAMLVSWWKGASIGPEQAVTAAGQRYRQMFLGNAGLPAEDKDDFLLRSRMTAEPAASYRLEQYVDWLRTYGPLWVTVDASPGQRFSPHARVLVRIARRGDGQVEMTFLDPATGGQMTQTFEQFLDGYEEVARQDTAAGGARPQVVHLLEPRPGVGGAAGAVAEGFRIEGPFNVNEPLHESITLAAMLDAGVPMPPGTEPGDHAPTDELLRGVLWNDDPAMLLFDEDEDDNWNFSTGLSWFVAFWLAKSAAANNVTNLTGRSHFFDLQFLHAMAETPGEQPGETLARIMMWAETMYRLSIGEGVAGTDRLGDVGVVSSVELGGAQYSAAFASLFDEYSRPTGADTLAYLLGQDTAFTGLDVGRRAIGSLLHVVQDSYARGHVRRELLNPGDLVVPGSIDRFKPGTYGRWGAVENFHSYRGQSAEEHDRYDSPPNTLRPTDLTSFNGMVGAREAVEVSSRVLSRWRAGTPWAATDGPKEYLEGTVFAISPDATPADSTV